MFDDWDNISKIYTNASAELTVFLDSNLISQFINQRCHDAALPLSVARQLVLYCRLYLAGLATTDDLLAYCTSENLPTATITPIVETCLQLFVSAADYESLAPAITAEVRQEVAAAAPRTATYLLTHNHCKLKLAALSSAYPAISLKKLQIIVGDIILGFYQVKDTVPLLQQELGVDPRTAALLGADVLEFLAPLSDPHWQPPAEDSPTPKLPPPVATPFAATTVTLPPVPPAAATPAIATFTAPAAAPALSFPSYQPTAAEPIYHAAPLTPAATPLSGTPSYLTETPTANPTATPQIDRPRWSSEL